MIFRLHPNLTFACEDSDNLNTLLLMNVLTIGGTLYFVNKIANNSGVNTKKF